MVCIIFLLGSITFPSLLHEEAFPNYIVFWGSNLYICLPSVFLVFPHASRKPEAQVVQCLMGIT